MNDGIGKILKTSMNKSHLYGQIKSLQILKKQIIERIIILEADLVKIECNRGK